MKSIIQPFQPSSAKPAPWVGRDIVANARASADVKAASVKPAAATKKTS